MDTLWNEKGVQIIRMPTFQDKVYMRRLGLIIGTFKKCPHFQGVHFSVVSTEWGSTVRDNYACCFDIMLVQMTLITRGGSTAGGSNLALTVSFRMLLVVHACMWLDYGPCVRIYTTVTVAIGRGR